VNLFCFTLDGGNPRFDRSIELLMKCFIDSFGTEMSKNMCVVYTRWPEKLEEDRHE
jgi:hypothetical protein